MSELVIVVSEERGQFRFQKSLNYMRFLQRSPRPWSGGRVGRSSSAAGGQVVTLRLNMFTLIAIGVGAAFVFSAVAMLMPGLFPDTMQHEGKVAVNFEAAAMVTALVLLGQVLELRARSRTGSAIKGVCNLAPPTARKVADGGDHEVLLDQVEEGHVKKLSAEGKHIAMAGDGINDAPATRLSSVSVISNALRLREVKL